MTLTDERPERAPLRSTASHRANTLIGVALVVGYLVVLALAMSRLSYDIWGAFVIVPVLAVATIPLFQNARARESDPWILKLLVIAFAVKMVGTVVRYAVTFDLYAGRADAGGYHGSGTRLAEAFWDGRWAQVARDELPEIVGTEFMRLATGLVYIVTGPTKLGGFFVFSWLSFVGLYWFYRAFRVGFPQGDQRRYAVLVFFMPSLLYWPSSIGKEAWMLFALGLASYGAALLLRSRSGGLLVFTLGLAGTALVRPHISALAFGALLVAYLIRRQAWSETSFGLLGRLAGIGVLLLIGAIVLAQTASFFNLDDVDQESVEQVLDRTEDQSAKGGSEFVSARPKTITEVPGAFVTVLFRPFAWEAGSAQALVASLEGVVLLLLFVLSIPRLVRLPRLLLSTPYVMYAVAFTLMFVVAFSSISNFGIIARQRTLVFPLVFVVLALPVVQPTRDQFASRRERRLAASQSA